MLYGKKVSAKTMSKPTPKKIAIKAEMMTPKEMKKVNSSMTNMMSKPTPAKMTPLPLKKGQKVGKMTPLPLKKGQKVGKMVNF